MAFRKMLRMSYQAYISPNATKSGASQQAAAKNI
jgi:hypothetical protein